MLILFYLLLHLFYDRITLDIFLFISYDMSCYGTCNDPLSAQTFTPFLLENKPESSRN